MEVDGGLLVCCWMRPTALGLVSKSMLAPDIVVVDDRPVYLWRFGGKSWIEKRGKVG